MKNILVDLLRESVLIQATIALASVGVVLYLYAIQRPVPQELISLVMLIVGYYFGSKTQLAIHRKG